MKRGLIKYRGGYKYQLAEDYTLPIPIDAERTVDTGLIRLDTYGILTIRKDYAWDGPSGPTFDSKCGMRGSLVHDALYQLMRQELIGLSHRPAADELFYKILLADGMWRIRAWFWRREVKKFAAYAALPENDKKVITAP
jgi:hypothetical protein